MKIYSMSLVTREMKIKFIIRCFIPFRMVFWFEYEISPIEVHVSWFLADGSILGDVGNCGRWGLAGGSGSLEV
jgi:hypothetical protein